MMQAACHYFSMHWGTSHVPVPVRAYVYVRNVRFKHSWHSKLIDFQPASAVLVRVCVP